MTRRKCSSKLRRRYGCFKVPRVPGATTKEVHRKGATWLARTDPKAKTIEFSEFFDRLKPLEKKYITLHERAHLETGTDHNEAFYSVLKKLIAANKMSWRVAFELENANCHKDH
jgi:hypothetical protein